MPTFRTEPDDKDRELAELRLQLARLFRAAKDVLRSCDYMTETGRATGIPRGQVARLRVAVEAVEEAGHDA